ncbi:MAG: asparagine synthetase B [Cyclobacteriaceae bacterium]|nr:MAG: asparagine synthetase B [Cyclobacteriaceae bacterium]
MCGISGFVDPAKSHADLQHMLQCLHHRGPDAQGIFFDEDVGLAHNRLSIIDLTEAANQPFRFQQLVLVYNGEIYNYTELRPQLEARGYTFTTHSDTEVLIKGYHCWGIEVLSRLIGMFAFAVYDVEKKELVLVRDRLGIKPLFYRHQGKTLQFASELKAFAECRSWNHIDLNGFIDYLAYGYTAGTHTFFKGIKKLLPGHYLVFKNGTATTHTYWDAETFAGDPITGKTEEQLTDELEELMIDAFRYRMVADVPVGIFFSGGIDSTALVALLSRHFGTVNTFTIGFDDTGFDETPHARKIAAYFKTNHTERILGLEEARNRLQDFYRIYDEPFYDSSGIPTSLVSELACQSGMKVVLSSEGGDELFGGYPSYQRYYKLGKQLLRTPRPLRKHIVKLLRVFVPSVIPSFLGNKFEKTSRLLEANDWQEFYQVCVSTISQCHWQQYVHAPEHFIYDNTATLKHAHLLHQLHPMELFMLWDLKYLMPDDFLVKIDRATMYYSLEAREPFLDHRLVEFCLRLPLQYKIRNSQTKYLLRKVLNRYLPSSYIDRPKMGFSVPLFTWFKSDMDKLFQLKLSEETFSKAWPSVNYSWVARQLRIYQRSKKMDKELNIVIMWKLLGLMLWLESLRNR